MISVYVFRVYLGYLNLNLNSLKFEANMRLNGSFN